MFVRAPSQAAGGQAKVPPTCIVDSAIIASVPSVAPIGITPPANPLPSSSRSGSRSQRSTANIVPQRPIPVCTSSAISAQP